jgi:hypothetical protein
MSTEQGHPRGKAEGGGAFEDVAATDYTPKTCGLEAVDRYLRHGGAAINGIDILGLQGV